MGILDGVKNALSSSKGELTNIQKKSAARNKQEYAGTFVKPNSETTHCKIILSMDDENAILDDQDGDPECLAALKEHVDTRGIKK